MVTITADIAALSSAQRKAVALFITNFPTLEDEESVIIPSFSVAPDEDEPTPEAAFTNLDKAGYPWDERIHASSRAKTADGYWRKKRGIDDAIVVTVESQLKELMAIPVVVAQDEPAAPVIEVPALPTPLPPPPPPVVADRNAYIALIQLASNAMGAKKLTQEQLTSAVTAAGVPTLALLGNRLDLVPQVTDTVNAYIAASAA